MFPNQPQLWVSHETIYQDSMSKAGIVTARIDRRKGVAFRSFSQNTCLTIAIPRCPTVVSGGRITDRTASAADRAVPGNWAPLYMSTPWGNEEFPEVRRPLCWVTYGGCAGTVRPRS